MSNPEFPGPYQADPRSGGRANGSGREAPYSGGGRDGDWQRGQAGSSGSGRGAHARGSDGQAGYGRTSSRGTGSSRGTSSRQEGYSSRDGYAERDSRRHAPAGSGRDSGDYPGWDRSGPGASRGASSTRGTRSSSRSGGYDSPRSSGYDSSRSGGYDRDDSTDWAPRSTGPGRREQWGSRVSSSLRTATGPLRLGFGSSTPGARRPGPGGPGGPGNGGPGGGRGRGGGRQRRKGDWWRHWSIKKALTIVAAGFGAFVMLAASVVGIAYAKTPIPDVQSTALQSASTVYFADGKTVVGKFGDTNRQVLTYSQIPALLRNAVVAAEDKNFWHEGGISPTGILRAAYYDMTSSGGNLQGGSTITQQLVRNYYQNIGTSQTMSRKVKEIFVAEKLAQTESKEWILTRYLNTVYFGAGAYGIAAAAQTYFGVPVSKLDKVTPAQAAMIAAMIQSPSGYSPNPKAGAAYQGLVFRWKYVLDSMQKMGTLSLPQEAAALKKFPVVVPQTNLSWGGYRGYIMQAVQYELEHTYGYSGSQLGTEGLRIITTFDKHLMGSLYRTVEANEKLMRHGTPPTPPFQTRVGSTGLPSWVRTGALLEQPGTGAILAMYSGRNWNNNKYDNALQSRNQVGSSFKPYVLATAVSQGMNVKTSHLNGYSPLWIPPDSSPMTFASVHQPAVSAGYYQVRNDEVSNPNRPVSVTEATAMSLNTSYTDLWHRVALTSGNQYSVVNMAKQFGVDTVSSGLWKQRDEAGTALGQASLTVEEQATMMATLANHGEYVTPHVIAKIINDNAGTVTVAKTEQHQVLTPDQVAEVDYAMSQDMGPLGTANGLGMTNGQTVIGKTGTTNLGQSAFFLGATPKYAMAVGMFVEHPGCTLPVSQQYLCSDTQALAFTPPKGLETLYGVGGLPGYGGGWPAVIWHDFFNKNFDSVPVENWPPLPLNFGSAWNLVGKLPKPHKPHQPHHHQGGPGHGCPPFFHHHCQPSPHPTVTPTVTPTPTPTPSPSSTATCQPGTFPPCPKHSRTPRPAADVHGSASGPLALAAIAGAVPVLPFAQRLRRRRRSRSRTRR